MRLSSSSPKIITCDYEKISIRFHYKYLQFNSYDISMSKEFKDSRLILHVRIKAC